MEAKENRPDACTASGTAKSIYKYFSTDAPDIQEEKGWLCLPEDCAADIVSFCEEQSIAYDNLLAYAALSYLQGIDPENPLARDTLKFELLTLTNRCIDAYNLGKRDPNAAPGAKRKDAYPDEKQGAERYKSRDLYGKSRRKRRRRASNLADDLTREGIEAYFEEKQRELEAQEQDAPAPEVLTDVPETAEPAEQPSTDFALDVYGLDRAYVSEMASDLQKAHIHRSREEGKPFMDERYERLVEARNHPDEQLAKLREDVDAARREFHASKEARDTLQRPCPGLLAGMHVFAKAGRDAKDPVSRMMADMTAMMLRMMIQEALAEEARRQREEAERRVYESRRSMWDAEKRLKAAEKALSNEDERETKAHAKTMRARYARARSVSPSAPRSAGKDTQFGE